MRSQLRKSDRKVADIVLQDPRPHHHGDCWGKRQALAEVSQPTVVRFCKRDRFATASRISRYGWRKGLALGTPATHSVFARHG